MALNFPDSPTNNQVYTDAATGEQWKYETATNSWTSLGLTTSGGIVYKGGLNITSAPPTGVASGWTYTVTTGGTPNAGFNGLTGTVQAGSQIVYDGAAWQLSAVGSPWSRTGTVVSPANTGDQVHTATGKLTVGGTAAAPNLEVKADGGIVANTNGLVYDAATKRLGVGTGLPQSQLQVLNQIRVSDSSQAQGSVVLGDGGSALFNVGVARWNRNTNAPGAGGMGYFSQGNANNGGHHFYIGDAAAGSQALAASFERDGKFVLGNGTNNAVSLDPGTTGSPLVRDSAGNLGIGMTPTFRADVAGPLRFRSQLYMYDTAGTSQLVRFTEMAAARDARLDSFNGTDFNGTIRIGAQNLIAETGTGSALIERARLTASGQLLVGTSSASQVFGGSTVTGVQIEKSGNSATRSIALISNASSNFSPSLAFGRSGGTSNGSVTSVASGDTLGAITWGGADGTTAFINAGQIICEVDGTPGTNDMPGRLVFSVTPDSKATPEEAMRIKNSKIINFANAPTYADNATAKAGGLVAGDVYKKADGTLMITF